MEQRHAQETYLGHKLEATAYEERPGWWSWTYTIEGRISGRCATGARLPDAEMALRRAMLAARARADELG